MMFWVGLMQKTINSLIKWLVKHLFLIANIALICIYLAEFQIASFVFVLSDQAFYFGFILLAIYSCTSIILAFIRPRACSIIFLVATTLFFWVLIIFYTGYHRPYLVSSVKCNGITYYLTIHPNSPITIDWYHYRLTKWDGLSNYDSTFFGLSAEYLHKITCDKEANQIRVFGFGNTLYYTEKVEGQYDGQFYDWQFGTTINNYNYDLESYEVNGLQKYIMLVCSDDTVESCQIIPIDHSTSSAQKEKGSVIADTSTNDIYILFDGKINYAYGNESREFKNLASVNAENNHQYNIVTYAQSDRYSYVLYVCSSTDYSDCDYIPFSYSTPDDESANLEISKDANQLVVYIGEKLVFAFNNVNNPKCFSNCSKSQCFVDDCTIPNP